MNLLKHRFVSGKSDGADASQVQPSNWNDGHTFSGGAAGDVLTRDPTDPNYGAKWGAPPGQWIDVPFDASRFAASGGMIWAVDAGDVTTFAYAISGRVMTVFLTLYETILGGAADVTLYVTVPGIAARVVESVAFVFDPVTNGQFIRAHMDAGDSRISFVRVPQVAWPMTTSVYLFATISFPLA
jgi:hypothetical protein